MIFICLVPVLAYSQGTGKKQSPALAKKAVTSGRRIAAKNPAAKDPAAKNSVPKNPVAIKKDLAKKIFNEAGFDYDPEKNWRDVMTVLENYQKTTAGSDDYAVFGCQMKSIAEIAYRNRAIAFKPGWANDFVLLSFVYAADDLLGSERLWIDEAPVSQGYGGRLDDDVMHCGRTETENFSIAIGSLYSQFS